jgi:DNA polymerase I-like protein with 3'-5' exonuclease and polymerase domains
LAKLFRRIVNDPKLSGRCLLINTVHDSIIFDIHTDVLEYALEVIKTTMESADGYLKEFLNIDFDLPVRADVGYGPTWLDQKD